MSKIFLVCREVANNKPITMKKMLLINKDTKIFTMGSCFAIELKKYLHNMNYNVLEGVIGLNLIWYNTYSILYEFERITGEFKQDKDDVWKLTDGRFQDPYRRLVFGKTKEELLSLIEKFDERMRNYITQAEVLIITLGLVEVWKKPDNGRIICASPGYGKGGGRGCLFKFASYEDNLNNMKKAMDLLRCINDCKVIITTSPVPLGKTFRNIDHLIANTESKSILRTVCGQLERKYENVIYYPSYEIAMNANKNTVFKPDGRHVKPGFISGIMKHFEDTFKK